MALLLLIPTTTSPAHADCPAAPISDPDDMAISFLAANGVQAASASLLASTVKEGIVIYDDANDTLKLCDGDNWIAVGSSSGTDTLASLSCAAGQIAKFNGSVWACATDGGGSGGAPGNPVAFSVTKTVNQTVTPATWTKITWNSEGLDSNNNFDMANNRFQPTIAGLYQLNGSVQCFDNNTYCGVSIYKNGALVHTAIPSSSASNPTIVSIASAVYLNGSTDYGKHPARARVELL